MKTPTSKTRAALLYCALFCVGGALFAEENSVSHGVTLKVTGTYLVTLEEASPLSLSLRGPGADGGTVSTGASALRRLYYTLLSPGGNSRKLTANLGAQEAVPAGTAILLAALRVPAGCGRAGARFSLDGAGRSLLTDIGNGATGFGEGGIELMYDLVIVDPSRLAPGKTETVSIILTLTDAD